MYEPEKIKSSIKGTKNNNNNKKDGVKKSYVRIRFTNLVIFSLRIHIKKLDQYANEKITDKV